MPLLSDSVLVEIYGVIIYGNRFKKTTAGLSEAGLLEGTVIGFILYFIGNWTVLQIMSGDLG